MSDLAERYNRLEGRARAWPAPTWILGLVVVLLSWSVGFALPSPGIDVSWWAGLYMAAHQGLDFGTEVVFTYGPLGFLKLPFIFYDGLASIAFVYGVAIAFAFSCALIWTLRSRIGAPLACLIALLAPALLPLDAALGLAVLWGISVLSQRPPRHSLNVLIIGGAVFAAAEVLMKLSTGPVIFLVLLLALIGARAKGRQIAVFLGTFVVALLALWLIAGQSLGELPDFAGNTIQIILGYNEAMATYGQSGWLVFQMILGVILALVWSWFGGQYPDRRTRLAGTAIVLVVGAAMYKQGVVRMDAMHVAICFTGLAVLWAAIPAAPRWNYVLLTGLAALTVASIHVHTPPGGIPNLDAFGNLVQAKNEVRTLLSPSRKQAIIDDRRTVLKESYAIDPELLRELEGRTVSVDPWEITAAWAYELDWSPLPVFQNYSAYTSKLDELNADEVESPDGPERILRGVPFEGALDGRNFNWDPPEQAIATLCHFEPGPSVGFWQVLRRVPDRCGPETLSEEVEAGFGDTVEVPAAAPDEVVFARVEGTEPSGLEKLRGLFYKPRARTAILSDGSSFRLVTSTADDGLLLRAGQRVGDVEGGFSQVPETDTLRIDGGSGDLRFEFYRMKVRRSSPSPGPADQ